MATSQVAEFLVGEPSSSLRVTKETLLRYHAAIDLLVNKMGLPASTTAVSGSMQSASTTNWACFYALQPNVFSDKKAQMGTTILTAALLCGFAMTQFLDPAISCRNDSCSENEERIYRAFAFLVGLSACLFLVAIILCSTELMALILPYSDMDTLENWIRRGTTLDFLAIVFTYVGFFLLLACMLLSGFFQYPNALMAIEALAFAITSLLAIHLWYTHQRDVNQRQDVRVLEFISEYCDKSGFLNAKSRALIHPNTTSVLLQDDPSKKEIHNMIERAGLDAAFADLLVSSNVVLADLFVLSDLAIITLMEKAGIDSPGHCARIVATVRSLHASRQEHLPRGGQYLGAKEM
uniref:Uncharacterized protein n=1 Tax=Rhizochromulina marina TaxID=1034831 RepID=A0A7S2SS10_9STRA|mmetsp:Transcript_5852/g.17081  ORF Transcript_5852/g.17081 Transcript_5852/m.17081 type:complete len:350 (+) Transcript_5852:20-1069(+)